MSESGNIIMPDNVTDIWMSEQELGDLFGVIAPTFRASIRAIYKSGALKEYEVQKYIRLENGYHANVFSLTMIVALAFRINSFGAEQMRNAILKRMYLRKEKTTFFQTETCRRKTSKTVNCKHIWQPTKHSPRKRPST